LRACFGSSLVAADGRLELSSKSGGRKISAMGRRKPRSLDLSGIFVSVLSLWTGPGFINSDQPAQHLLASDSQPDPAAGGQTAGKKKNRPGIDVDMSAIPADEVAEAADLRKLGEGFRVYRTLHFSVLYDTSEEDVKAFSAAIEKTFRSNLRFTMSLGLEPKQPGHKLIIYYFAQHQRYSDYSKSIGKGERPQSNPGVFFPDMQRSMFYNYQDQAALRKAREDADARMKELGERLKRGRTSAEERKRISQEMQQARAQANASSVQGGDVTESVVQHEVTHHVLWNIGYHNPDNFLANPRWFAEGTAMMFETVSEGKSGNIGAVNKSRLREYQAYKRAGKLLPLPVLISRPEIFNTANETTFVAYAQSWALVHYLTRARKSQVKRYVELINARPKDYQPSVEKELKAFEKAFGKPDALWIDKWQKWMERVR